MSDAFRATCSCGATLTLAPLHVLSRDEGERQIRERVAFDAAHAICRERRAADLPPWPAFHRAWTAARDSPGYDKAPWLACERQLLAAGVGPEPEAPNFTARILVMGQNPFPNTHPRFLESLAKHRRDLPIFLGQEDEASGWVRTLHCKNGRLEAEVVLTQRLASAMLVDAKIRVLPEMQLVDDGSGLEPRILSLRLKSSQPPSGWFGARPA